MSDEEEKPATLRQEILDKFGALITAAFGLIAALAWNDTMKAIFKEVFGKPDAIEPMLIYSIIVTAIAVILILIVSRAIAKARG